MADSSSQHAGYIDGVNLTISICLTYTLCVSAIRVWIRRRLYGWDDIVVGAATIFILGFYATSYVSLWAGLGKNARRIYSESDSEQATLNRSTVARNILFIITLYLSKAGVVAFLQRTTKTKSHQIIHYICFGLFALFGVGSIIAITVDCGNPQTYYFWDLQRTKAFCPSQPTRWQIVTALDIVSELAVAALPLQLMWGLQMKLRKKVTIVAAFWIRLPVIGFSLAGNYWAISHYPFSKDPGLAGAIITIWQEVEAAYSLAAVTMSASKAFADACATGFGWGDTFREAATQYALENSMNSRSAGSRVINSKRRSGGSSGNRSRIRWRDAKKISPNVTTVSSTDTGTDIELTDKADPPIPNYAQNEYNYGAGNSPRPRTGTTNSMDGKTGRGSWRNKLAPQTSEYQDPLTDEQEEPMKLRPERKLRNTAVITSDPTFFPYHTKRPLGEGGSVESSHTDDMVIVRNVDYSVQYDEAPILESAQRSPSSDDRQTSL